MNAPPHLPHDQRSAEFVREYSAHSRRVYTYLLTLLPNRADAEEVFQEVSMLLWEKFDEFTLGTSFVAWACKVAQFKARKFQERASRRGKLFSDALLESLDAEMQASDESLNAEYGALAECFARLPQADRELIERRYRTGGDPKSLSAQMRWPIKKMYSELRRIRRALLACITRRLATGGGS
jgi:RNA polymerase sigma-70 factor (ECF subfamily)